ncbi:MAG: hypothetical protein HPAVJP_4030 [Candidatus Hepatoplasma vulgare]|nr:MAG: hypothetical protein HPAVJP_4030 [Candidatus Hepatoplasma sp.]
MDVWLIVASDLKDDRLMFISGILSLLIFLIAIFIYTKQKIISKEQNNKLENKIEEYKKEIINLTKFFSSKENEANILKESQDKLEERLNKNLYKNDL